nr:hypothetical protein [Tanacetum cinerariifolium]
EQRAAKKQRIDEEKEEIKRHLQIVVNDDDVFTEATPLALNKDGTHKLFFSFITILKNFDREDLEMLWKLVQERFQSSEPKNFSDDFLLNTFKTMFEKPNVEANIWREQKGRYGLAKVKSWKLFKSCGVHIITFTTTQMFLLVEKKYLLTRFTLEQMLNNVRLEVEEESEMSLELLRLQALVDRKKVVITEAAIRDVLRLGDAEGVDCLPNEEIFAELARMGYEKPSTKPTFYKTFFSSQWKFLIHTILQSMSVKCTSWNEFSSAMAFAVICLSTGAETPLFEGMLVEGEIEEQGDAEEQVQDNVDDTTQGADTVVSGDDVQDQSIPSPTPPTQPPQQPQDLPSISQVQSPPPQPQSLPPAQPQGADFPMSLLQEALDACATLTRLVEHLEHDKVAQYLEITKLETRVKKLEMDNKVKALKLRRLKKEDEPEVHEAVEVVTTAKLIIEVVAAVSESVTAASATIVVVPAATITATLVRVAATSTRRRKEVVIKDPEKESTAKIPAETKSKDKGKGIMVEEPKPMKKKQQVEMDEELQGSCMKSSTRILTRVLQLIMLSKKIRRIRMCKDIRLDYFKGMSYDDIRQIFESKFNSNIEFLLKLKKQIEEEENGAIESINETPAQKATKRRKLNEDVKDLK